MSVMAVQTINIIAVILWIVLFVWALKRVQTISRNRFDQFLWILLMLILPVFGAVIVLVLVANKGREPN